VSTILKALQRLEDEKRAGKDRSLNEQVVARRSAVAVKSRWAVMGVSLLGGIAVGSTALYFWPDAGAPAADVTSEAAAPVVASSASQPQPEQRVPEAPAKPPRAAQAKKNEQTANRATTPELPMVEVVNRLDEKPAAESVLAESSDPKLDALGKNRPGDRLQAARERAKQRTGSTPSEPTDPRPVAAVSKPLPEPPAAEPPVVIAAADPTAIAAGTAAQMIEKAAVIADPPRGAAGPSQPISASTSPPRPSKVIQRAEIPLISVGKTVWHPDADRRSAIVELTESGESLQLKEGDAIGPLVIETIKPSGVLFIHDGVEIEYRVGR
jgi:hypothetical protein